MIGDMTYVTLVARLVLAGVLGSMIGLERESHRRPAGLRTHILVAVGSCLITVVSMYGFIDIDGVSGDPARVAASIVSGIGFLGAGTILRDGTTVRGLTTAASLWVVAGIGLATAAGFTLAATVTAVITNFVLAVLDRVEVRVLESKGHCLQLDVEDRPAVMAEVAAVVSEKGAKISTVTMDPSAGDNTLVLKVGVDLPEGLSPLALAYAVRKVDGVSRVEVSTELRR